MTHDINLDFPIYLDGIRVVHKYFPASIKHLHTYQQCMLNAKPLVAMLVGELNIHTNQKQTTPIIMHGITLFNIRVTNPVAEIQAEIIRKKKTSMQM